jgi:hypothetical protein
MKDQYAQGIVHWLHNNETPDAAKLSDPVVQSLANLAGLPLPRNALPRESTKTHVEQAIDWLRRYDPNAAYVDEPSLQGLSNLTGQQFPQDAIAPHTRTTLLKRR